MYSHEEISDVEAEPEEPRPRRKRTPPNKESVLAEIDSIAQMLEKEIERQRGTGRKVGNIRFLQTVKGKVNTMRGHAERAIRTRKRTQAKSGLLKPYLISQEMNDFAAWHSDERHSRVDVMRVICAYVRENDLQNPGNRREIFADETLSSLLKLPPVEEREAPLTYASLQKYIGQHILQD